MGEASDVDRIGAADLIDEARSWGLSPARAHRIVAETVERFGNALTATAAELPGTPAALVEHLELRASEPRFQVAG